MPPAPDRVRSELPSPASQHLSPGHALVDDGLLLELNARRWEHWARRARDEQLTDTQRAYARRRAGALGRPYTERLERCATAGVVVKCGCPGRREVRWYTCRQHLACKLCRKQRARKYRPKIHAALEARLEEASNPLSLRRMYSRPNMHLVMLTLTLRPSGDLERDRAALMSGWRTFYKANNHRWGRFAYVGVVELHKSGVAHLHVVCIWPVGWPGSRDQGDWQLQRELWLQSCPQSERIVFSASKTPSRAARYVSKYVSKGVQADDYTPELRARIIAAAYNTRWVFTSHRVWVPFAPCCPACGMPVIRARFRFPDAPPRSMAERLRLLGWSARGGPEGADEVADGSSAQLALALPEADRRH